MKVRKNKGRQLAALQIKNKNYANRKNTDCQAVAQRKPENYFLDAATLMHDGDATGACVTAYAGICAARGQHGC